MWIGPSGNDLFTGAGGNPTIRPGTGELIFSDITSANRGLYVCRAVVNIPESHIFNHFDDATITVNTDSKSQLFLFCINGIKFASSSWTSQELQVQCKFVTI